MNKKKSFKLLYKIEHKNKVPNETKCKQMSFQKWPIKNIHHILDINHFKHFDNLSL